MRTFSNVFVLSAALLCSAGVVMADEPAAKAADKTEAVKPAKGPEAEAGARGEGRQGNPWGAARQGGMQQVRSVTYTANDVETTRYFEFKRDGETTKLTEVSEPGGAAVEGAGSDFGWLANALGLKEVEAKEGEAAPDAAAPAEGDRPRRGGRVVQGPDGKQYRMNMGIMRNEDPASAAAKITGPNGETVKSADLWVKGEDGTWKKFTPGDRMGRDRTNRGPRGEAAGEGAATKDKAAGKAEGGEKPKEKSDKGPKEKGDKAK